MKKYILSLIVLAISAAMSAQIFDKEGVHPYEDETRSNSPERINPELSHWSIYLPVGMTFADMDESGGAKLGSGINNLTMNMGLGVEYSFTPVWSLALEFNTANYGKKSFTSVKEDDGTRKDGTSLGVIYNLEAWLQYDLMDGFFPKRQQTIFNLYAMVGGGLGFYQYQRDGDDSFISTLGTWKSGKAKNFDRAPFIGFGALADFNLTRQVSLGIRALYQYYMSDNLDLGKADVHPTGEPTLSPNYNPAGGNSRANSNNDGLFTADLVLHYNFEAVPRSHARNLSVGKQAELERWAMEQEKEKDAKGEAKPFVPQKDTLVISHKDTVVMKQESQSSTEVNYSDLYFVYFDNNRSLINEQGHIDIQQMAARLEHNPNAYLELSGFCDNTGSDELNDRLAQRRAEAVRKELIEVYGIDADRLIDVGRGKLTNVKDAFGPNRRVDMRMVSKEEFDAFKKQLEEEAQQKAAAKEVRSTSRRQAEVVAEEPAAPVSEEARMAEMVITWDTTKYVGMEVTTRNSTLSKYARKYYNNTYCWVYIYQANREVLKTPNFLWSGAKVYMPLLTEEQKNITKEEADELYRSLGK